MREPLYLSQLSVGGSAHNVVFVATEHDSVYAFDSDTGAQLWKVSLLGSGETTSDNRGCGQVTPEIGITSTPVIDRTAGAHGIAVRRGHVQKRLNVFPAPARPGRHHRRRTAKAGRSRFRRRIPAPAPTAPGGKSFSIPSNTRNEPRCCY